MSTDPTVPTIAWTTPAPVQSDDELDAQIFAREDELQAVLDADKAAKAVVPEPEPARATPPTTPEDIATEKAAFAELLAFINAHKDAGTVITHVSADDFVHGAD